MQKTIDILKGINAGQKARLGSLKASIYRIDKTIHYMYDTSKIQKAFEDVKEDVLKACI